MKFNVVNPKEPRDGLYLVVEYSSYAYNGDDFWCGMPKGSWKSWQGDTTFCDHYHYEHNVLVLPKEYLT